MIYDRLERLGWYQNLPHCEAMLEFMRTQDMMTLPTGDIDVVGHDLYLRVFQYTPYPPKERRFETHRAYADVHIVLQGIEEIHTVRPDLLRPLTEYDATKDIQFWSAEKEITSIVLGENEFAFFAPGESHKPMLRHDERTELVRKFVFKVRMGTI